MTLIDSHAHFDDFAKEGTIADVLSRAQDAGVTTVVAIGGGVEANRIVIDTVKKHPGHILGALGFDRYAIDTEVDVDRLRQQLSEPGVVAVGETGLDYHYSADTADAQKTLFSKMLEVSVECALPVVVHSREADGDTCALLRDHASAWKNPGPPGVLHCFTGSADFAERLLELGYMISFSGIITFKNADELRSAARTVPDDRYLIETDAPYLAPAPYRGKPNEPSYVAHVAAKMAEIRGVTVEDVARVTTLNARRLFGLKEVEEK